MRKRFALALGILAAMETLSAAAIKVKDLPPQYRRWLEEEVVYIIGPKEKEVFLELQNDREREMFIQAFWKQRDPNPTTEKNEFKEEHYKRITFANQRYGRGAPGPGWRTDRGRIHIILGEPQQISTYDNVTELYPVEIWFYQGISQAGLPSAFSCVFFRRDESSDYELYSPVRDGPGKLLRLYEMQRSFDPYDYLAAYSLLHDVEPAVAQVSLSLIAGEESMIQRPSLASDVLLANINQYQIKRVKEEYAEKFLKYKDIVEVDYSANYIDSACILKVTRDASGLALVNYALEPKRLSVESFGGRFTTRLDVNGLVSDKQGRTIYQFERKISLALSEDDVRALRARPFSLQGVFPMIEGVYSLNLIVKNMASKEFSTIEQDLVVPPPAQTLAMGPLLLGYGAKRDASARDLRAFSLRDLQLHVSTHAQFTAEESLHVAFQLLGPKEEQRKVKEIRFIIRDDQSQGVKLEKTAGLEQVIESGLVYEPLDLRGLGASDYRLEVTVVDETGKVVLSEAAYLGISPVIRMPRPLVYSDTSPALSNAVYSYLRGGQYFNKGDITRAKTLLEEAYRREPASQMYALGYARFLLQQGQYQDIRSVLEPFLTSDKLEADTLEIMGRSYQALGDYAKAIAAFADYLTKFGTKLAVFNALGECYARTGDRENALFAWEKSLELNPNQEEIKKAVAALKEKK